MWASSMALAGFQFCLGKAHSSFPLHGMGHELSSMYDMTHGVTLALLTPAWMRHTLRTAPATLPLFAQFARNVFACTENHAAQAAEAGIQALTAFYATIRMPANLRAAGVREEDLTTMAARAVERGDLAGLTTIGKTEAVQIFRDAF